MRINTNAWYPCRNDTGPKRVSSYVHKKYQLFGHYYTIGKEVFFE